MAFLESGRRRRQSSNLLFDITKYCCALAFVVNKAVLRNYYQWFIVLSNYCSRLGLYVVHFNQQAMLSTRTLFALILILLISCKEKENARPCETKPAEINKTVVDIAEYLGDSSFTINDTALVNELLTFTIHHPYQANIVSVKWNIDNGGFTSANKSLDLRFTDTGNVAVELIVGYQPLVYCGVPQKVFDTVKTTLHLLAEDRNSALEGKYTGYLDTAAAKPFTVAIKYFRLPGDSVGAYYLYNYVQGCTGDGINTHIPAGTGYEIVTGYRNFYISTYACAASNDFKGFGYLNTAGDSITIKHFGYSTPDAKNENTPQWHVFKGKRQ